MVQELFYSDLGAASGVVGFLRLVGGKDQEPEAGWFFRGQRDASWPLVSRIDRPQFVEYRHRRVWSRKEHEIWLLKEFKKRARPHLQVVPESDWEWLAIAQHHGLATRLLDWTLNPLAALFFAVEGSGEPDSAVFCYQHRGDTSVSFNDPFSIDEVLTYHPPHVTPRITVQAGAFTCHPTEAEEDLLGSQGVVRRIRIEGGSRGRLLGQLDNLGINRASLFPDIDAAATYLNVSFSTCGATSPVG